MDISDPACEVWVCGCGNIVPEKGPCFECECLESEPLDMPGIMKILAWIVLGAFAFLVILALEGTLKLMEVMK